MKQTVSNSIFRDAFKNSGRFDDFGGAALDALFDYFEELEQDCGIEMELDVIAICCEWSAYDVEDLFNCYGYLIEDDSKLDDDEADYGETLQKILEALQEHTTVIEFEQYDKAYTRKINGTNSIVVMNTSRLWRDNAAQVYISRTIKKLGGEIYSVEQPRYSLYSKDPQDFLINSMIELLDQYERLCLNLKLAKGRTTKAKQGHKPAGRTALLDRKLRIG